MGVKPSLEVKWGKVEEEKRRRRQLLNQSECSNWFYVCVN